MNFSVVQDSTFHHKFSLNCRGKIIPLSTPVVMGIINCTPDSFHSDSRAQTTDAALVMAERHLAEGATLLDIGACSTRPGAPAISINEEIARIVPVVKALRQNFPNALLSIDTFQSEVVAALLPFGVDMINDVSAAADEKLLALISRQNIPYVLMHNQDQPNYNNINADIYQFFLHKMDVLKKYDIKDVVIDLGFGFAKDLAQNYQVLSALPFYSNLHLPILIGVSRKSMVYKLLDVSPADALNGSTAIHAMALLQGANILRVHDVKEAKQVVDIFMQSKAL